MPTSVALDTSKNCGLSRRQNATGRLSKSVIRGKTVDYSEDISICLLDTENLRQCECEVVIKIKELAQMGGEKTAKAGYTPTTIGMLYIYSFSSKTS